MNRGVIPRRLRQYLILSNFARRAVLKVPRGKHGRFIVQKGSSGFMHEQITSRENPCVKHTAKLLSSAKYRSESNQFVVEGVRLCMDAVLSGVCIEKFFYTRQAAEKYGEQVEKISKNAAVSYRIGHNLVNQLFDTKSPQGVVCVCKMLDKNRCMVKMDNNSRFVVLENMQDPSNMGTVLRTAEALGINGVVLSKDCCDVYSPKVLRGSMGAVFRISFAVVEQLDKSIADMNAVGLCTYAAVPAHDALAVTQLRYDTGAAMVIGNEGNGLTQQTIQASTQRVTIPMRGRAESLNAAAAAGILMWEMMR